MSRDSKHYCHTEPSFQIESESTLPCTPSEYRSIPSLPGEGYTRSVRTASPSLTKTSTLERSKKICSFTRELCRKAALWRPGNSGAKDTSPDLVRSKNTSLFSGAKPRSVSSPSPLRRRNPISCASSGANSDSISRQSPLIFALRIAWIACATDKFETCSNFCSRSSFASAIGSCINRVPSGNCASLNVRGSDCAPRHAFVGSRFAYCQLLIHPIQILRPSFGGISENEFVA